MPNITKAGTIRSSAGNVGAAQYPATVQLTVFRLALGYVNNVLLNQTTPGRYVGQSNDQTPDLWTFTLDVYPDGTASLNCESATVGGTGGFTRFDSAGTVEPVFDSRGRTWTVQDFDPEVFFDENEVLIFPAAPKILPQTN